LTIYKTLRGSHGFFLSIYKTLPGERCRIFRNLKEPVRGMIANLANPQESPRVATCQSTITCQGNDAELAIPAGQEAIRCPIAQLIYENLSGFFLPAHLAILRSVNLEEVARGGIRQEAILNFVNLQELARGAKPSRPAAQLAACPAVQLPGRLAAQLETLSLSLKFVLGA
jgi:hypothetical protein